jgi:hypothetical protein
VAAAIHQMALPAFLAQSIQQEEELGQIPLLLVETVVAQVVVVEIVKLLAVLGQAFKDSQAAHLPLHPTAAAVVALGLPVREGIIIAQFRLMEVMELQAQ